MPSRASSHLRLDDVDYTRLRQRRQVAELVALARDDLAHDAPHDLTRARLGQVRDDVDLLGRRERPDDLAHLEDELLDQAGLICGVVLELASRMICG
jgi:hypothetical protein